MKKFVLVIPARYESTRFPGKPLTDILGKPMIQRVYEQCTKAVSSDLIYIATESHLIRKVCEEFGAQVIITRSDCKTGTDRIAEVAKTIKADNYINVQGDEPVFDPNDIIKIIKALDLHKGEILNGYCALLNSNEYLSYSVPKVVFRSDGRLLYMSRSPIPGNKSGDFKIGYRQVCAYSFPREALRKFGQLKKKTQFECEEDIEILRFLELGYEVRMLEMSNASIPVDHLEDVEKVTKQILDTND